MAMTMETRAFVTSMTTLRIKIGYELFEHREAFGYTLKYVATRTRMTQQQIAAIEKGDLLKITGKVEPLLQFYQQHNRDVTECQKLLREYDLTFLRLCIIKKATVKMDRTGLPFRDYRHTVQAILKNRAIHWCVIFPRINGIVGPVNDFSYTISVQLIQQMNTWLKAHNLMPQSTNYLFEL